MAFIVLILVGSMQSCDQEDAEPLSTDSGKPIVIFNHTGHLVQQSSDICGHGITARFVLSSNSDQQEYVFGPDSFRTVSLDIEEGEIINIKVYEVISTGDVLLIDRNRNFELDKGSSIDLPTIILCPKDDLQFEGF